MIYIESERGGAGAGGGGDIFVASRATVGGAFGTATALAELNSPMLDGSPTVTSDALAIYFLSQRTGTQEIWTAQRATVAGAFGLPVQVAGLDSASHDTQPYVLPNGATIYYYAAASGIMRATRSAGGAFGTPVQLNSNVVGQFPVVTPDELTIFFAKVVSAPTDFDIWMATRSSLGDGFGPAQPVTLSSGSLNTNQFQAPTWISPDGCTLYFSSNDHGGLGSLDLFSVTRPR